MSRSHKKPYYTDQHRGLKAAKRLANKRVRKAQNLPSGGRYKCVSCSYTIRDWIFHCPEDRKAYRK